MHHVVMPWKDRSNYLRITLATLKEAARGRSDITLHLFNNCSEQCYPEIIDELDGITVLRHLLPVSDCHHNYVHIMEEMFSGWHTDYIIFQDSDACFHPEYFDAVDCALDDLPDMGVCSLFHENIHPIPKAKHKGIYHVRKHCSFFSLIVKRRAWEAYKPPGAGESMKDHCMDGDFTHTIGDHPDMQVYSTIRSYVDHMGMQGVHICKVTGEHGHEEEKISRARCFYSDKDTCH